MNLFGATMALLKIVSAVLDMIERRRLLTEGEINALRKIQGGIDEKINRALAARAAVMHDAVSVSNDPNNRDNRQA